MVTIDDLIRQYPEIGHADFVKIDTEGYEVEIVSLLCPGFLNRTHLTVICRNPNALAKR